MATAPQCVFTAGRFFFCFTTSLYIFILYFLVIPNNFNNFGAL